MSDENADKCWAMLALAAPSTRGIDVSSSRIGDFIGRDTTPGKQRSALLVAGLAGLGRIDGKTAGRFSDRFGLGLSRRTSWSNLIDAASVRHQAATVAVLAGTGLQASSFESVPAMHMRSLIETDGDPLLVPVPLHSSRLWTRGFNQAALLAGELARLCDIEHDPFVLQRGKRTAALKGMSPQQRKREVAGAFKVEKGSLSGRRVILVDDVLTTGSTANGCAKALLGAGADRVDLICWARVVRPAQLVL